jgi:diguanylate cyclase (GGDEF)-like protein
MWKVGIGMFLLGALTLVAVVPAPDPDASDHPALLAMAGYNALCAVVLTLVGPRWRVVQVAPLVGIFNVSALVAIAEPVGATPFFYLWPLLQTAYFLSKRLLVVYLGFLLVTYGAALALFADPGIRTMLFMGGASSISLVGILVNVLKRRLDGVVEALEQSATTDSLTGLLNRRAFEARFDTELERARRAESPLALVVFDLDFFKQVNDRFGHARGDTALRRFAELLSAEQRPGDAIARTGGEEFAVLLPGSGADGAVVYAERVACELRAVTSDDDVPLSTSAGVAELGVDLSTRDELMSAADAALYGAKAAGRQRVAAYAPISALSPAC